MIYLMAPSENAENSAGDNSNDQYGTHQVNGQSFVINDEPRRVGRCDMELGDVTHHNVEQLKRLNQAVFPVTYNDKFYKEIITVGELAKLAYFNDIVVGGVCCRIDAQNGMRRLYIMTLGTLAPYRR
uniref:N-terminal methionine N(alpha)-acetyltransferase NatE n=2 Tax=Wuchereria bancrofti TaxID=6293 RepID=A0A1I8EX88_WUCBA